MSWGGAWTGLVWLRTGTCDGHLWMQYWTFRFHQIWGISWLAENQLGSEEGFCSMEWVSKWVSKEVVSCHGRWYFLHLWGHQCMSRWCDFSKRECARGMQCGGCKLEQFLKLNAVICQQCRAVTRAHELYKAPLCVLQTWWQTSRSKKCCTWCL